MPVYEFGSKTSLPLIIIAESWIETYELFLGFLVLMERWFNFKDIFECNHNFMVCWIYLEILGSLFGKMECIDPNTGSN